jgi:glutathione-regulated potassium-efflux system ancillary protein KefG
MPPTRILLLFAHPAIQNSRVNRRLAEAARSVEGLTFHDLYEAYPEFDVDVAREQELLSTHDLFVMQHPFYWYSTPALLKEWQDLVLEHGWAYGSGGIALRGKTLLTAVTTGGREASYGLEGGNRYAMRQLLAPIEQTARLCGMDYLPPFVVHGTHALADSDVARHADDYRRTLEALRDGRLDVAQVRNDARLNARLDEIVRSAP